jgi:DNA mismatch repair protein MutS2
VEAEDRTKQLQAQFDEMDERREELLEAMRRDVVAEYESLRKKLKKVQASLSWNADIPPDVEEASREIAAVQSELRTLKEVSTPPVEEPVMKTTFKKGDLVDVQGLAKQGTIVDVNLNLDEAEVSVGNIRIRVELHRISRAENRMLEPISETPDVRAQLGPTLTSADLDIRGLRVEDAMIRLDEFLDNAVRDGMSRIRIIHGRGTGALREAAREHLTDHVLVRSYRRQGASPVTDGVTLVELA